MKREPSISEQQAREIVERMGRRESRSEKSMDDFYRNIGLDPEQLAQPGKTVTKKAETVTTDEPSGGTPEDMAMPQKRVSSKQRKLSLDEYRTTYLQVPKITDRKPVFVSGEVRDKLDEIVRRLGGRGMSASGLSRISPACTLKPTGKTSSNGANSERIAVEPVKPLDALHRFDRYAGRVIVLTNQSDWRRIFCVLKDTARYIFSYPNNSK